MTQFADLNAYDDKRIKNTLTDIDSALNDAAGSGIYIKLSENNATFRDSVISNGMGVETFQYLNVRNYQTSLSSHEFLPGLEASFIFFMDE